MTLRRSFDDPTTQGLYGVCDWEGCEKTGDQPRIRSWLCADHALEHDINHPPPHALPVTDRERAEMEQLVREALAELGKVSDRAVELQSRCLILEQRLDIERVRSLERVASNERETATLRALKSYVLRMRALVEPAQLEALDAELAELLRS